VSNIKDVAKDAGVSIATVSNVINSSKYVSEELCLKVEQSMKKLDYNINTIARNLRSKVSMTIGVVLQNINDVFFTEVLIGLEEYIRGQNYSLMFFNTNFDEKEEVKAIESLRTMWIDGILLDSCVPDSQVAEYSKFLFKDREEKKIPIVLLERDFGRDHNAVVIDNLEGAYSATKHLIDIGKKKILNISGKHDWSMIKQRSEGYKSALLDSGMKVDTDYIEYGDMNMASGYDITRKALEYGKVFDGIFAINDRMAVGAMLAIKDSGIKIPEDIAVVGFDNISLYNLLNPSLTTINVPKYQLGYSSAKSLIDGIKSESYTSPIIKLPTKLIIRKSTDPQSNCTLSLFGL
jgi:LacI family transcriptional regulator